MNHRESDLSVEVLLNTTETISAAFDAVFAAVCIVLAAMAVMYVWFYGSIFRPLRARINASDRWLDKLLSCPFCMTFYISAAVSLIWRTGSAGRFVVQWLAIVAIIHWLWARFWSRLFDR